MTKNVLKNKKLPITSKLSKYTIKLTNIKKGVLEIAK